MERGEEILRRESQARCNHGRAIMVACLVPGRTIMDADFGSEVRIDWEGRIGSTFGERWL